MAKRKHRRSIGNFIAPPRFLLFALVMAGATWFAIPRLGMQHGVMAGFDVAALVFFLVCIPLLSHESERMRIAACRNDANRAVLLLVSAAVTFVILVVVATELIGAGKPGEPPPPAYTTPLIVGTLALSWLFSNLIYALHYAHQFYSETDGKDAGGIEFPKTPEPDYWDFIYFAYCLGMTFQTSDVSITNGRIRRIVTMHCLAAFVFNLGIIGFTINLLAGKN
jgi:uncharacterized membrane protein